MSEVPFRKRPIGPLPEGDHGQSSGGGRERRENESTMGRVRPWVERIVHGDPQTEVILSGRYPGTQEPETISRFEYRFVKRPPGEDVTHEVIKERATIAGSEFVGSLQVRVDNVTGEQSLTVDGQMMGEADTGSLGFDESFFRDLDLLDEDPSMATLFPTGEATEEEVFTVLHTIMADITPPEVDTSIGGLHQAASKPAASTGTAIDAVKGLVDATAVLERELRTSWVGVDGKAYTLAAFAKGKTGPVDSVYLTEQVTGQSRDEEMQKAGLDVEISRRWFFTDEAGQPDEYFVREFFPLSRTSELSGDQIDTMQRHSDRQRVLASTRDHTASPEVVTDAERALSAKAAEYAVEEPTLTQQREGMQTGFDDPGPVTEEFGVTDPDAQTGPMDLHLDVDDSHIDGSGEQGGPEGPDDYPRGRRRNGPEDIA